MQKSRRHQGRNRPAERNWKSNGDWRRYKTKVSPERIVDISLTVTPPSWYKPTPTKYLNNAQRGGHVYERQFGEYVIRRWGGDNEALIGPWIKYRLKNKKYSWAQPDIVLINHETKLIYIFECKLSYNIKAYYQLINLYSPLIEKLYPEYFIRCIQVCRNCGGKHLHEPLIFDAVEKEFKLYSETACFLWNWQPVVM